MKKIDGAFLTIGELAGELGLPQHILRYWESRFPQLRPLQRSGNRRYYRPADVELAHRIHRLLNVEGFTVRGAQKILADGGEDAAMVHTPDAAPPVVTEKDMSRVAAGKDGLLARLETIRAQLAAAFSEGASF